MTFASHDAARLPDHGCLQVRLSAAREVYRPVAANGALLYFLINNLHELDRCYHFSMANFVAILGKGAFTFPALQTTA